MPTTITATERRLAEVFNDQYLFTIPLYQRPYAWTTEETGTLLDDLMNAVRRDPASPYFLGSVVLIKEGDVPTSEVVDGQQRLTTLTMLLCVLRDISGDMQIARDLDQFIRQEGNTLRQVEDRFRFCPRERDQAFFTANVQEKGGTAALVQAVPDTFSDSQKRVCENVRYLHEQLMQLSEGAREGLASYLVQQCYLVVVSASERESAYRIFSVMNDRGLDLSPTDILEAEILGEIGREYQAEYAAKWEGIEEALGREEFRALFNHVRMIYKKDKQRETLQGEFRDGIVDTMTRRAFVDDVLEPYSNVFETISRAAYASAEDAEKVNALLRHLHMLDNVDWVPPLMVWFRWCSAAREHPLRFTRDLERLAYGLFIRRANVNERTKRYARVLECIERHDDLFGEGSPLQISRQEAADIVARLDGNIYEQPRIPTPLLLRMDSALAEGASRYHYSIVSVEHVLPQNPTADSQWVRWFPDTDERERWTHRLANLVSLSRRKNARASNYEFERKKQEYFQREGTTTFAVTTQVINEATWTPAVLERRQGELVAALKREWRLE